MGEALDEIRARNHDKSPVCAAFVKAMREEFGQLEVTHVKEGDFEYGRPTQLIDIEPVSYLRQGKRMVAKRREKFYDWIRFTLGREKSNA